MEGYRHILILGKIYTLSQLRNYILPLDIFIGIKAFNFVLRLKEHDHVGCSAIWKGTARP